MAIRLSVFVLIAMASMFLAPSKAYSAVPNSLLFNEGNAVSGDDKFLASNSDLTFGRVEGNGQNWFELLVVQGDEKEGGGFANTLDLRGWTINWTYEKTVTPPEEIKKGDGVIKFSEDPLWAAVPRGTLITVSEWSDAWYENTLDSTPGVNGYHRAGGYNGLGTLKGAEYDENIHFKLGATPGSHADPQLFATDTSWNPAAGVGGDWRIHVFAGELNPDQSHKYFSFTGTITEGTDVFQIGIDDKAGLFAINNDNWEFTTKAREIEGQETQIIQNRIGESAPGNDYNLGSDEVLKLEGLSSSEPHTVNSYLGVTHPRYGSGTTSTFGKLNTWSSGSFSQNVEELRNWLIVGDANLDGTVSAADYVLWRAHEGGSGGWREGDFSGDGMVDGTDYALWRSNYGAPIASSGAVVSTTLVPEPGSFLTLTMGLLLLLVPSRQRENRATSIAS